MMSSESPTPDLLSAQAVESDSDGARPFRDPGPIHEIPQPAYEQERPRDTRSPRRTLARGTPSGEMVETLQAQAEAQEEELGVRRREVQELHVLLQQLQIGAWHRVAEQKAPWWQRLLRSQ